MAKRRKQVLLVAINVPATDESVAIIKARLYDTISKDIDIVVIPNCAGIQMVEIFESVDGIKIRTDFPQAPQLDGP